MRSLEERAFSAIGGDLMMYDDRDELAILGAWIEDKHVDLLCICDPSLTRTPINCFTKRGVNQPPSAGPAVPPPKSTRTRAQSPVLGDSAVIVEDRPDARNWRLCTSIRAPFTTDSLPATSVKNNVVGINGLVISHTVGLFGSDG